MRLAAARFFFLLHRGFENIGRLFFAIGAGIPAADQRTRLQRENWKRMVDRYTARSALDHGLTEWESAIVTRWFPRTGRILVIGCGGGREMLGLAKLGYEVSGYDISPEAVATANEALGRAGLPQTAFVSDTDASDYHDAPYNVVFFSWYVYAYIFPRSRRIETLQRIRPKLASKGLVVLVLLPRRQSKEGITIKLSRLVSRLTLNPSPMEPGDFFNSQFVFLHGENRAELEQDAQAAGFRLSEWIEGQQLVAVLTVTG